MLNKTLLLLSLIFLSCSQANAQTNLIYKDSIFSSSLKESRNFQVVLPENYDVKLKDTYDVLYVLDGEWYTKLLPDAYGFAKSAGFAPATILVLIPNTYTGGVNQRNRDFEPFDKNNSAGYDSFLSFIQKELFLFIDHKYPNNGSRSLLGSSLGGLFTVYTFLTAPDAFQAYLACDPNLDWHDGYLSKLAKRKLPGMQNKKAILFIATNDYSFKANGGYYFKEALKTKAAKSLKWQVKIYDNETHYSLQYKAFYDAIRYSYAGFYPEHFDLIPQGALIEPGKALRLYIANKNPTLRFTLDGKEPDEKSVRLSADAPIVVKKPATLKIKNLATRQQYASAMNLSFKKADSSNEIKPSKIADTLTNRSIIDGNWKELPPLQEMPKGSLLKKGDTSSITAAFASKIYLISKTMKVHQPGYYVFALDAPGGARIFIQKRLLIDNDKHQKSGIQSFAVYLKPGYYTVSTQLLQTKDAKIPTFRLFRTTKFNDKWWENELSI